MEQHETKVFESLPKCPVTIVAGINSANEGPRARKTYGFTAKNGETIWVTLTVHQVVEIVRDFFRPATMDYNRRRGEAGDTLFMRLLDRLLKKRWAMATSPEFKDLASLDTESRAVMESVRTAWVRR